MLRQVWSKPSFVEMPEFRAAQGQYSAALSGTTQNSRIPIPGHGTDSLGFGRDNGKDIKVCGIGIGDLYYLTLCRFE